jgi:hypothetical protein
MKTLFTVIAVLTCMAASAQTMVPPPPSKNTTKTIAPIRPGTPPPPTSGPSAPPPAPAATNSGNANTPAPVYKLTSVRVKISTGSDNKEFPSKVEVSLIPKGKVTSLFRQLGSNMRNEMKVNSTTEFGLDKSEDLAASAFELTTLQNSGIDLRLNYMPNFILDAWKIEGITLTLEFRDANNNLHPQMGTKTIVFNNASGTLTHGNSTLVCTANGQFVPLTASIRDKW